MNKTEEYCLLYNTTETVKNLYQIFGNSTIVRIRKSQKGFSEFVTGNINIIDEPRSGHSSVMDSNTYRIE